MVFPFRSRRQRKPRPLSRECIEIRIKVARLAEKSIQAELHRLYAMLPAPVRESPILLHAPGDGRGRAAPDTQRRIDA